MRQLRFLTNGFVRLVPKIIFRSVSVASLESQKAYHRRLIIAFLHINPEAELICVKLVDFPFMNPESEHQNNCITANKTTTSFWDVSVLENEPIVLAISDYSRSLRVEGEQH